jgi:quercetin dioxygenase-like cupin family protein
MKSILGCVLSVSLYAACATASASPPTKMTATVLNRATFDAFTVGTGHDSSMDFAAKSKTGVDVVVRQHVYEPGASTGWHTHPGPILVTIKEGTLTFYEYDDPTCTPKVLKAGQGYVDDGHGHMAVNASNAPAVDVSVILAPVAGTFRDELPAPNPRCGF